MKYLCKHTRIIDSFDKYSSGEQYTPYTITKGKTYPILHMNHHYILLDLGDEYHGWVPTNTGTIIDKGN